jgi:hypothetical protein
MASRVMAAIVLTSPRSRVGVGAGADGRLQAVSRMAAQIMISMRCRNEIFVLVFT